MQPLTRFPDVKLQQSGLSIYFTVISGHPLSEMDCMEIQAKEGYMPQGYGFYSFSQRKTIINAQDVYVSQWVCSSSCE